MFSDGGTMWASGPLGFDGLGRILSMVRKIVDRPTPNSSASSAWA
jgi:hypothetical protein